MIHRGHIFHYTPCFLGSAFGNIASGTIFVDALPMTNNRHTSSCGNLRGKHISFRGKHKSSHGKQKIRARKAQILARKAQVLARKAHILERKEHTLVVLSGMSYRGHIFQYTPCSPGSVFGNIALGTIFVDTLPMTYIRHTSSCGKDGSPPEKHKSSRGKHKS